MLLTAAGVINAGARGFSFHFVLCPKELSQIRASVGVIITLLTCEIISYFGMLVK